MLLRKRRQEVADGISSKDWIIYSRKLDMSHSDFSHKQEARALKGKSRIKRKICIPLF